MIFTKQILNSHLSIPLKNQAGFTLIESLVAMLMMLATLGGLIPLFVTSQLANVNNQIRTGAIAVAQSGLEDIRQTPVADLPALNNPVEETEEVEFMGKTYSKVTTYCPLSFDDEVDNSNDIASIHCAANTSVDETKKDVQIQVNYGGNEILTIETVYTSLE